MKNRKNAKPSRQTYQFIELKCEFPLHKCEHKPLLIDSFWRLVFDFYLCVGRLHSKSRRLTPGASLSRANTHGMRMRACAWAKSLKNVDRFSLDPSPLFMLLSARESRLKSVGMAEMFSVKSADNRPQIFSFGCFISVDSWRRRCADAVRECVNNWIFRECLCEWSLRSWSCVLQLRPEVSVCFILAFVLQTRIVSGRNCSGIIYNKFSHVS